MKNRKFISLYETIYDRYKQGAGFLQGDVVKLKSNYKSTEGYKTLSEMLKQRLDDAEKSGYNLRIGRLHTPQTNAGSLGINVGLPATHADLYQEPSPGSFGNLVTIPIDLIEYIDTGVNLPQVSAKSKRPNKSYIKPGKWKSNKDEPETKEQNRVGHEQNWVKKGDYKLAEKNVKPSVGGNKYDDESPSKFKPLNGTKKLTRESVGLEGIYTQMITEDATNEVDQEDQFAQVEELIANFGSRMNDSGGYGEPDRAKVYGAIQNDDFKTAAEEICYSYTDQDGGEIDCQGHIGDIESELKYIFNTNMPSEDATNDVDPQGYSMPAEGDTEFEVHSYIDKHYGPVIVKQFEEDHGINGYDYLLSLSSPEEVDELLGPYKDENTSDTTGEGLVAPNSSGSRLAGEVNPNPEDREQTSALEAKNHMGDRLFQTYAGWKRACKLIKPDAKFNGDRDIDSCEVGEWDGAEGSVYNTSED